LQEYLKPTFVMKETIHANIGSIAFTLDRDAYEALRGYMEDIRSRLPEDDTETLDDIERRIAEVFREQLTSPMRVVTIAMVRDVMERMGRPELFGQRRSGASPSANDAPRRLCRSRTDRSVAGVCGGIADFFGVDPTLIRIVTILLILFGGLSLWVYIILWIVIPEEPAR